MAGNGVGENGETEAKYLKGTAELYLCGFIT